MPVLLKKNTKSIEQMSIICISTYIVTLKININTVPNAASREPVNILKLNLSETNSDHIINHTAKDDAVKPSYHKTQLVTLYFDNGTD